MYAFNVLYFCVAVPLTLCVITYPLVSYRLYNERPFHTVKEANEYLALSLTLSWLWPLVFAIGVTGAGSWLMITVLSWFVCTIYTFLNKEQQHGA